MPRTFSLTARCDAQARVFISETDVPALHIEAATLDEFLALAEPLAARRLADNLGLTAQAPMIRSAVFSLDT